MSDLEKEVSEAAKLLSVEEDLAEEIKNSIPQLPRKERDKEVREFWEKFDELCEREELVINNLEKGNNEEGFKQFKWLVKDHREFDYQKFYNILVENNAVSEEKAEKLIEIEEKVAEIEENLIAEVKQRIKQTEKNSYSPVIYIPEVILEKLISRTEEATVKNGQEFAGIMHYNQVKDGLAVNNIRFFKGEETSTNASSVDYSEEILDFLENSTKEKFIAFHSHPSAAFKDVPENISMDGVTFTGDKPSESDTEFAEEIDLPINLIAFATRKFLKGTDWAIFAYLAKYRQKEEIEDFKYLPIKVTKDGEDITDKIQQINTYNKALKDRKGRYSKISEPESLKDRMEEIWEE